MFLNAGIDWLAHGLLAASWWQIVLYTLVTTHITIASVTIYLHRHQAHRAMDLHALPAHFFRLWLWLGTGQVTKEWVSIHRKHHAKCETLEDPHSPQAHGIKKVFCKLLVKQVSHIRDFYNFTESDFTSLHDVGPKVANSLFEFFNDEENKTILDTLEKEGLQLSQQNEAVIEGVLSGKSFVFTGFRNEIYENKIIQMGGEISNTLSKKTSYLVMKSKGSGSSKEKKALDYGTEILDENDLTTLLDSNN